jgi:hypothetical protein
MKKKKNPMVFIQTKFHENLSGSMNITKVEYTGSCMRTYT